MSLLYRAIWEDSRSDLRATGETAFVAWLRSKGVPVSTLEIGESQHLLNNGPTELSVRRAEVDGVEASWMRLVEDRRSQGERWTTTFVVISHVSMTGGTFWVDIERVSDDPFTRPPFRAPRLVLDLIESGTLHRGEPRVGHVRLEDRPVAIKATSLAGLIKNESRRVSLAVFSHDEELGQSATMKRALAAHKRLAGVAVVFVLPPTEIDELRALVGEELAVWGGAARLYLPNLGPRGLQPQRHRYLAGYRMKSSEEAAAEYFVQVMSATVPATPPPEEYEGLRRALVASAYGSRDAEDLLVLADEEIASLNQELERLRGQVADRDESIDLLTLEVEDLELELNRKSNEIAWFARSMSADGSTTATSGEEFPVEVSTVQEALDLAESLEGVELHPDACRDIDKLDAAVSARAWANGIWRALRALDSYAMSTEEGSGGFWEWCQQTHSPWSWPATPKKLAMKESESVRNDRRLSEKRMLPVDPVISTSGEVFMEAHIKIAEGGGPLAPRLYFLDDTSGPTGKIHIGFVGPHEHMPNKSTN